MGYTHYWRATDQPVPSEAFGRLAMDAAKIIDALKDRGLALGDSFGDKEVATSEQVLEGRIIFNGLADEACETFCFDAQPRDFDFCKTGPKPYDEAVTAVLIRAKVHYGSSLSVSSDGTWDEWKDGAKVCADLFGAARCPFDGGR